MKTTWTVLFTLLLGCAHVAGCLLQCLVTFLLRRRRIVLDVSPRYRAFFGRLGFSRFQDFFDLEMVIVSGHPDRHVGRLTLHAAGQTLSLFLKREHAVPWTVRLASALGGFGFTSRCVREARLLEALEREGIGCPTWVAAGEDGAGKAFVLLCAVPDAVELREYLAGLTSAAARRDFARRLGHELARLHEAGFEHPDLYSKHIYVEADSGRVVLLDWQRGRLHRHLSWRRRCRGLAALHATLGEDAASGVERSECWKAYLNTAAPALGRRSRLALLRGILQRARCLLAKRHIREKRQPPLPTGAQSWKWLQGEALCTAPQLEQVWPASRIRQLDLDHPAWQGCARSPVRRWLPGVPGGRLLLIRRRERRLAGRLVGWLRRRAWISPEQRQASLLLRLERHGVTAPRPLAMGQRCGPLGRVDSFLLMHSHDALRLDVWLRRAGRLPALSAGYRDEVLREVGLLVRRLHRADCYLAPDADLSCLGAVLSGPDTAVPVLTSPEAVQAERRRQPARARADVSRLCGWLREAGCAPGAVEHFLLGYRDQEDTAPATAAPVLSLFSAPQGDQAMADDPSCWVREPAQRVSFWQRLTRGAGYLGYRSGWLKLLGAGWAERIMDLPVTDRFHAKQGRSTGRLVLTAPGGSRDVPALTVYLKRHYLFSWWRRALALLHPGGRWSPAMQEWEHLEWAHRQGIPVPRVAAVGEMIGPGLRFQSFLAVEELGGMLPLHEAIPLAQKQLAPAELHRWKRSLVVEVARIARMLHDRRYFHKDLYLCHFFIPQCWIRSVPDSWRGQVYLIDLHRLSHHPFSWRLWQTKDLAQLLYSSEIPGIDDLDRLRFWKEYHGAAQPSRTDHWLRRLVLFKWRRYRSHNARRKAAGPPSEAPPLSPPAPVPGCQDRGAA